MDDETIADLFEALGEEQQESMDKVEQLRSEGEARTDPKPMYYLGKDVGIARAKDIIRNHLAEGE